MSVWLVPAIVFGICFVAIVGTFIDVRHIKRKAREKLKYCPGQVAPTCQCDGTCNSRILNGTNCSCVVCYAVQMAPVQGPPVTYGGGGGGSSAGPVFASGGIVPAGSSSGIMGGGGASGSSGVPQPCSGIVPAGNASGIMQRITPRPKGRGASGGMAGFAEKGSAEFDFAVGTVRGLRQWNLTPPDLNSDPTKAIWDPVMKGATGAYLWHGGLNEAECNSNRQHQPPVDEDENGRICGCGFWAYWNIRDLASGGAMTVNPNTGLPITGLIEGFGRVLVGEKGFRSQMSKVVALAPAFSVQAYSPPSSTDAAAGRERHRMLQERMPNSDVYTSGYADSPDYQRAEVERMELERETRLAQSRADAWMGVIQDRLGTMFPEAKVYATLKGMLASAVTGEMPG